MTQPVSCEFCRAVALCMLDLGLVAVFFTVSESTPYDIEVAVDPEMLGKVFEELVTGRHETGSYYTPRVVVSFMCREALKGHLGDALDGISPDAIAKLVDEHDVSGINLKHAAAAVQALDGITVVDPACGSGAYLLGMLHELIELKQELFSQRLQRDPDQLYQMKLDVIERNIYGVDIDEFATNIAMLRLWLSLSIEFEGKTPKPLPNLDFKILCGDSLTAPNPANAPTLFRNAVHEAVSELARLKGEYMSQSGASKAATKRKVLNAEDELDRTLATVGGAAPTGSADWRIDFAEVFEHGGFDVVLANPPYVRADARYRHLRHDEGLRRKSVDEWRNYRARLVKSRAFSTLYDKWDLFIPFIERAVQLLRPKGHFAFIVSDAYNASVYSTKSHQLLLARTKVSRLDFCSDIPLFDANVRNIIMNVQLADPAEHIPTRIRRFGDTPSDFEANQEQLMSGTQVALGRELFRLIGSAQRRATGAGWDTLGEICYISKGMVVHSNERGHRGEFKLKDVVSSRRDTLHPKTFVCGEDLDRWTLRRVRFLEWDTPRAPAHFSRPTFPELQVAHPKLLARRICHNRIEVVLDKDGIYYDQTVIAMLRWKDLSGIRNRSIQKTAAYSSEKASVGALPREFSEELSAKYEPAYLLAVMLSPYASEFLASVRNGDTDVLPDDWRQLPIPPASKDEVREVVVAVDELLSLFDTGRSNVTELEVRESRLGSLIDQLAEKYQGKAVAS